MAKPVYSSAVVSGVPSPQNRPSVGPGGGVVAGFSAAGHTWIVVAKGVSCTSAKNVTRALAARTAALHAGQKHTVTSPLAGFTCVIASRGKPAGSCATAGAAKSIVWLGA